MNKARTREKSFKCCSNVDEKYKKVFLGAALLVLVLILSSIVITLSKNDAIENVNNRKYSKDGRMNRANSDLMSSAQFAERNEFALPTDTAKRMVMRERGMSGNILGMGNVANRNMRDNLLVVLGIKIIFLVAICALFVVVFKRMLDQINKQTEHKKVVHVVRQMPKTHRRIVKIASKK